MKPLVALLFALGCFSLAGAQNADQAQNFEKLDWKIPPAELLTQKYCPLDSSADAMMVQKEMEFLFVSGDLNVISRKRIKIYTDRGLSYAQFREYFDGGRDITSIEACSYDTTGRETELNPKDIHIEEILKSEKGYLRWAAKSFAVPNVTAGSVIDVIIRTVYLTSITPPVFRFQEDIPVGIARFTMNPKPSRYYSYHYSYAISNGELINPTPYFHDDNFICEARNIPAIENETYPLPERNLATDLWINLKGFNYLGAEMDLASSWKVLLEDYRKGFKTAFDFSKKAKKIADSLMVVTGDHNERIRLAHDLVRDRWGDSRLFWVYGAPYDISDLMKQKYMDPEEKAIVLWAILKHMGIESEVVWVCSDNAENSPMPQVPSRMMFDNALTWIPGDSLFLDPGDPGGEVGILDEALSDRLMCRPMAVDTFITQTPKFEKTSGIMADLKLNLADNGTLTGNGTISYHNQAAIEARRIFKKKGTEEGKTSLNQLLFRDDKKGAKSFALAPDSIQKPEMFQVSCEVEIPEFVDTNQPDFELAIYPGMSFETTTLDLKPPRKYPIYFNSKTRSVYTIEWNFGNLYHPANTEGLNLAVDMTLLNYKLLTAYDSTQSRLTVRRQYSRTQKLFDPQFTPSFEKFLQSAKKCDLSSITMVKN